jgi:hypothetical protein
LFWNIPLIDSANSAGVMEFNVAYGGNPSAFYPITISFNSTTPYTNIDVVSLTHVDTNEEMKHSKVVSFSPEAGQYKIDM